MKDESSRLTTFKWKIKMTTMKSDFNVYEMLQIAPPERNKVHVRYLGRELKIEIFNKSFVCMKRNSTNTEQ